MRISKYFYTDEALQWLSWLLAISVVIFSGVIYRVHASHQVVINMRPSKLPAALKSFPFSINGWVGRDVLVAQHIQRAAGGDDFINRLYIKKSTEQWANVYVVYSGQPRKMLGHRPEVCYVGAGWIHENSERSEFLTSTGRVVPCQVHRFYKQTVSREEVVVLNFYVLNGQVTCEERDFSGLSWRVPNIGGVPARYVAQIQINSSLENSVRSIAEDITNRMLDFFPDEKSGVGAATLGDIRSDVLK